MSISRTCGSAVAALLIVGTAMSGLTVPVAASTAGHHPATTKLYHQLPAPFTRSRAGLIGPVAGSKVMTLNFGLPIRNAGAVEALVKSEVRTHQWLTHQQVYARFAPTAQQLQALKGWLASKGFVVTHLSQDRTLVTARASATQVESVLRVQINNYRGLGRTFYSNAQAPTVPTSLGIQTISGLNNFARFHTDFRVAPKNAPPLPGVD